LSNLNASIVIPSHNENENIIRTLRSLSELKGLVFETIIVVDYPNDSTIQTLRQTEEILENVKILVQTYEPGPASAIRFGINAAVADCVVVMMADGSDDVRSVPDLVNLVNRGVAIACASRYMSGGQQIGGQRFKKFLSKTAGKILYHVAGVGTHDPTNSFKAYSRDFITEVGIESRFGFEMGIELISKAHRLKLPIAEIPTIWLDRVSGTSNFKLTKWIPGYLEWFLNCFGIRKYPKITNRLDK